MSTVPAPLQQISQDTKIQMARSAYWTKVRLARKQLSQFFQKDWDPNTQIPAFESWIYMTAVESGEISILGSEKVAVRTFETAPEQAARAVAHQTHRIATREEVDQFLEDRKAREAYCREVSERERPELKAYRASVETTAALNNVAQALVDNNKLAVNGKEQNPAAQPKKG